MDTEPLIHQPTDEDEWQESMALYWFDPEAQVGGALAFGGWVNRGQGITWFGVFDARRGVGVQRTRSPFPIVDGDRGRDILGCGGTHFRRGPDGSLSVSATDDETGTVLDLELDDFYPMSPFPAAGAQALASQARGHLESSGQGRGRLVLDGEVISIQPLYHRDGSWGPRGTMPVTSYSWSVGSCGPALSWSALSLMIEDIPPVETAFVARDGVLTPATSLHTLVTTDHDSLTVRRFSTALELADGGRVEIQAEGSAHLFDHRVWPDMVATDTLGPCTVMIDGAVLSGFSGLNRAVNPRLGSAVPTRYLGGSADDGLFR